MKKLLLFTALLLTFCMNAQIYEGFEAGMTKDEAKDEFRDNKDKYKAIDLGNGWIWRLYHQNFMYNEKGGLGAVHMTPKGAALGQSYDDTVGYLEQTKLFFDKLGYKTFLKQDYWNAPHNFGGSYGLLMSDPDKKRVVQLYPVKSGNTMLANLIVYDYNTFMKTYEAASDELEEKAEATGF